MNLQLTPEIRWHSPDHVSLARWDPLVGVALKSGVPLRFSAGIGFATVLEQLGWAGLGLDAWPVPPSLARHLEPRVTLPEQLAFSLGLTVRYPVGFRLFPQKHRNRASRLGNSIVLFSGHPDSKCLLVDDVWTTGSTIRQLCTRYGPMRSLTLFWVPGGSRG